MNECRIELMSFNNSHDETLFCEPRKINATVKLNVAGNVLRANPADVQLF